jgi:hypothetical protein
MRWLKRPPRVSLKRIKNAINMSDFVIMGLDYVDFLTSEENLQKFRRLQALIPELDGVPAKDCLPQIMEFTKLDRELRGLPPARFIIQNDPKLN